MAFHRRLELGELFLRLGTSRNTDFVPGRTKAIRRARSFLTLNHDHDDLGVTVSLNQQHVCALLPLRCPLDTRVTIPGCRGYAPSDAAICAIELRPARATHAPADDIQTLSIILRVRGNMSAPEKALGNTLGRMK